MRRPQGLAWNNGPLKSKDLIPRKSMVAATHTPCQGGRSVTDKGPWLSQPAKRNRRVHVHTGSTLTEKGAGQYNTTMVVPLR